MKIKFGTDGWRAIIGDQYTYENVRLVVQAFCDLNRRKQNKKVILGYDRRFSSELFAKAVAEVLSANNFAVLMSRDFCPTPGVSWMTKKKKALVGIVITASHNPYQWNGVKFKESDGGSASPEYTQRIEEQIEKNKTKGSRVKICNFDEAVQQKKIKFFDPHDDYVEHLKSMVDLAAIRRAKLKVVVDSLYGAGAGIFTKILGKSVVELRGENNPSFGGVNPEPIALNLTSSSKYVQKNGADIVLATDGDADRIGAMDEKGRFVDSHQIFSLLLRHLISVRGWKGDVIKTVSATQMIDRLAERFGIRIIETPIGFKHICQKFRETNALMGGEESGGIGIAKHVNERDGIFSGLLLLEILAYHRKPLSKIIQQLQREVGPLYFVRNDLHLDAGKIARVKRKLRSKKPVKFPGFSLKEISLKDGTKYYFDDGGWLLIRPSGTEPLLRVYAESTSVKRANSLIAEGKKMVRRL